MIRKVNHVGIAVVNIERAIEFFENNYGAKLLWRNTIDEQKIESAFISIGNLKFELIASLHLQSTVSKFIEKRGEGIHHISFEVDQFAEVIDGFKTKGFNVIGEADTKDFKAAFIHPQGNFGMLTEIIEPKDDLGL